MEIRSNIKVSIVDESTVYRKALKQILLAKGFTKITEADEHLSMLDLLLAEQPDVLIYDLFSSSERFNITVEKIKNISPKIKLMVLSFQPSARLVDFCISSGATGFCDKSIRNFNDFALGLEKIANGEKVILATQAA